MSPKKIGSEVKRRRKKLGWTTVELAKMADLTSQVIRTVERGESPSLRTLNKIARSLHTSVEALGGYCECMRGHQNIPAADHGGR